MAKRILILIFLIFIQNLLFAQVNFNFESIPKGVEDTLKFEVGSCAMRMKPFDIQRFFIFKKMEKEKAHFNLWLGDHVYMLLPQDYATKENMIAKYNWQRSEPRLKSFLATTPQYAVWDDHDYGPNNADSFFVNKKLSLEVFKQMWNNPSYGDGNEGVYFKMQHADAEIFMLDGRTFYVKGKQLLGIKQMTWLKESLKNSNATFKFLCFNIQVICDGGYENFRKFKAEYDDFMAFLEKENIKGVVFFSGDVHYAEISKLQRKNTYPLYDFTFSAFTSFTHKGKPNLNAVAGSRFTKNNYGLITITGKKGQRICHFECKSRDGKPVWEYNISEEMLR